MPLAAWRLLCTAIRRRGIVVLHAAVLCPHLHVPHGIKQSKSVATIPTHGRGKQRSIVATDAVFPLWKPRLRDRIADVSVLTNIFRGRTSRKCGRRASPDRIFHFRRRWQTIGFSCLVRKPCCIGPGVVPAQAHCRLIIALLVARIAPTRAGFPAVLAAALIGKASDRWGFHPRRRFCSQLRRRTWQTRLA